MPYINGMVEVQPTTAIGFWKFIMTTEFTIENQVNFINKLIHEVNIPSEYMPHPRENSILDICEEIRQYPRPEYNTAEYVETKIIHIDSVQPAGKENVGRVKGNDQQIYEIVAKNLERGYKRGKLPPILIEGTNKLANGNHRHRWYKENGFAWFVVDVYRPLPGFDEGDLIDEVGLLYQPQPDGTSPKSADYEARGIEFVTRQKNKNIDVTREMVENWVNTYARYESSYTRKSLIDKIFNSTGKKEFLVNYTRGQVVNVFRENGIEIQGANCDVFKDTVHRLYEASQSVFIRDFLPVFLRDVSNGIKTVINFYVNTNKIENASGIDRAINARIKEIEEIFDSLDKINGTGKILREHLVYGNRPPQIVGSDGVNTLSPLVKKA